MRQTTESVTPVTIGVATRGRFPGAAEYARDKIGGLIRLATAQCCMPESASPNTPTRP